MPDQERLTATAAWAERQGLLHIAVQLRQCLAAEPAEQ